MSGGGLLSGGIGIPDGAYRLLNQSQVERAVNWVIQNQSQIEEVVNSGTGGGAAQVAALIDDDGTLLLANGVGSSSKLATGIYQVVSSSSYSASGGNYLVALNVTPQGLVTTPGAATTRDYLGLVTTSCNLRECSVLFNSSTGELWATDFDYGTGAGTDRLAIFRPDSNTWEYILFPTANNHDSYDANNGINLEMDETNGVVYVRTFDTAGTITTLCYRMADRTLVKDVASDFGTQLIRDWIMIVDPANSRCLLYRDSVAALFNTSAGVPTTQITTTAHTASGAYTSRGVVVNGEYWFPDNAGTPYDWRRFQYSAGTLNKDLYDAGTDGILLDCYCYSPTSGLIYYMSQSQDYIKSWNPSTQIATRLGSQHSAPTGSGDRGTTLYGVSSLAMSADDTRIIALRGGSSSYPELFVVDPSDGSIDYAYDLPAAYAMNYYGAAIATDIGKVWSIGTQRIQEITFSGGEQSPATVVYKPITFNARMVSATTAQVELFETGNSLVRRDNPFYIEFINLA